MKTQMASLWKKWLYASEKFGNVASRIVLILLYFTLFALPGIASRLFSDKLQTKKMKDTYWVDTKYKVPKNLEESRNQG